VAYKHNSLLAVLILFLCSISCCVQQEKETSPEGIEPIQEEDSPDIQGQEVDDTFILPDLSGFEEQTITTTTSTLEEWAEKRLRDGGMTMPPVSLPPIPNETIDKSRDYLISKYGKEFESHMTFGSIYASEIEAWPGWTLMGPAESGGKYIIGYNWNIHGNTAYAPLDYAMESVSLVYTTSGKLYCTHQVMDCIKHPEYCPPYKIKTREEAIENFKRVCSSRYNPGVRADFYFYSDYYKPYTDPDFNESRYLWYFSGPNDKERLWAVYMDPQTGEIIHDDYLADKTYYPAWDGTKVELGITVRAAGIDYRVCAPTEPIFKRIKHIGGHVTAVSQATDGLVNQSREYLIAKFGKERFESSMQFADAYIVDFEYQVGCPQAAPLASGKKNVIKYRWDLNGKYPDVPKDEIYVYFYYTPSGGLYSTCNVIDCVKHPEYCPPYKINTRSKAIENFKRVCGGRYDPNTTMANFTAYSNYSQIYTDPELKNARFLWEFVGDFGHVYMDPQTGGIVQDDYYADKNYYRYENGSMDQFVGTNRDLGFDYRICRT
jgi:hypothetical protein